MMIPKTIDIYITDNCDLKCKMCNIGVNNRYKDDDKLPIGRIKAISSHDSISIEDCKNIIKQISLLEPKPQVYISGGEPLLQKNKVFAILKEAQKYDIVVGMNSNATLLDKKVAKELVNSGLKGITLSLDGLRDTHNEIRGSLKSYDNVINAIKIFDDIKQEKGLRFPKVYVLCALTPDNYNEIEDMALEFSKLPLDGVTFSHYVYTSSEQIYENNNIKDLPDDLQNSLNTTGGLYASSSILSKIDYELFFELIEKVKAIDEKFVFSPKINKKEDLIDYYCDTLKIMSKYFEPHCKWVNSRVDINSDGEIMFGYPCFQVVAGDIRKDKIIDVFNSQKISLIRKYLNKNHNLPICRRCCGNRK